MRFLASLMFLSFLAINSCNSLNCHSIYDDPLFLNEIEGVLNATIAEDSILNTEEKFYLFTKIQRFVCEDSGNDFKPGPPPFSLKLFPDVNFYFLQQQIPLEQKDVEFIKCQERKSADIQLDNMEFKYNNLELASNYIHQGIMIKFDLPIFNESMEYVLVQYELLCSGECGLAKTLILKREKNGWKINFEKINWVG
jgi:hypothetical protein